MISRPPTERDDRDDRDNRDETTMVGRLAASVQ
jgi:hypothetical protein